MAATHLKKVQTGVQKEKKVGKESGTKNKHEGTCCNQLEFSIGQ